jgi:uncharacterized membrane protein YkvA (DUF1232 family)
MTSHPKPAALSPALTDYLVKTAANGHRGLSAYIAQGAERVSDADLTALRQLLPQVGKKTVKEVTSVRLRQRLDALGMFIHESNHQSETAAVRECAFVLHYFLHGRDLIPDDTPEVGLLDDALLVETAFNRNSLALRGHWEERQRPWPENL